MDSPRLTPPPPAPITAPGGTPLGIDVPVEPGRPVLRWSSRAHSIPEIEVELARIWSIPKLTATVGGVEERHVAARTSVLNLVVIARRPEVAERCAATVAMLTGRHPSRTVVIQSADPDGPSWLDARIQAHCMLPRDDAPETCAEMIHLTAGGEAGRHLAGLVAPLVVHDLPVTVWWPDEPPLRSPQAAELFELADHLVVDGSTWSGDGLDRLRDLARLVAGGGPAVSDFALMRQSRWREAIASIYDISEFLPFLGAIRRIAVTYATRDEAGQPGWTNLVKPIYHVAWLASRLGLDVVTPIHPEETRAARSMLGLGPGRAAGRPTRAAVGTALGRPPAGAGRGYGATLRSARGEVAVIVRPLVSPMPGGTTLRVELLAERRGSELRADVTAEAETVNVRVWQDGVEVLGRSFLAPRRTDVDLLAEAIETTGPDPVGRDAIRFAARLAGMTAGVVA